MKNSAVVFSISVAVIITLFLVFSIFGILYFYWGDIAAVKDSLSTIAGFFGGFATLGAAVIAAYLFNDWKDEYNHNLNSNILLDFLKQLDILEEHAQSLLTTLMTSSQKELDYVDEIVPSMHRNEFLMVIKTFSQDYDKSQFNKWSLGNKYYILGGDYYVKSIGFIVCFLNEAFIELDEIKLLDENISLISNELIQHHIDSAISELRESVDLLNKAYSTALSDLKPSK